MEKMWIPFTSYLMARTLAGIWRTLKNANIAYDI